MDTRSSFLDIFNTDPAQDFLAGLSPNGIVVTNQDTELESVNLPPGHLLVGSAGLPKSKQLLGTPKQITVTQNSSDIVLELPQDIDFDSDVKFGTVTGQSLTPEGVLLADATRKIVSVPLGNNELLLGTTPTKIEGTDLQITVDTSRPGFIDLELPQDIHQTSNVKFNTVVAPVSVESELFSGGEFYSPMWSPGSLLVANSARRVISADTTTSNGISVDVTGSTVNLSLAQDIRTTASPTFAGLTLGSTKLESSSGGHTYTFPDVGQDSSFVMTHGVQDIHGHKRFTDTAIRIGDLILRSSGGGQHEYKVPNVGYSADFVMTQGNQTVGGQKTFTSDARIHTGSEKGKLMFGTADSGIFYDTPESGGAWHILDQKIHGKTIARAFAYDNDEQPGKFEVFGILEAKQDVDAKSNVTVGGTLTTHAAVIRSGGNDKGDLRLGTAESGLFYDTPESGGSWHVLDQKIHGKTIARAFAYDNDEQPGSFEVYGKLIAEGDFEVKQKSEFKGLVDAKSNVDVGGTLTVEGDFEVGQKSEFGDDVKVNGNILTNGISFPNSGGTLNYIEETYWSAFWGTVVGLVTNNTRNCELHLCRIGPMVTLQCRGVERFDCQESAPIGNYIYAQRVIPEEFRPTYTVSQTIPVIINDSTRTVGLCVVGSNGFFEIKSEPARNAPSTRFAGPDNGFESFSMSWIIT